MKSESSLPYLLDPTNSHNLSQINPIYTLPSYFHTICFSIVLDIVYVFQGSLFPFFSTKNFSPMLSTCSAYLKLFDLSTLNNT
jgi:hypothetical protein